MKCTLIISGLLLCIGQSAFAESDEALQQGLLGRWQESRHVDAENQRQTISLRSDGTFEVEGTTSVAGTSTPFVWRGTWNVQSGRFLYITTYSNPSYLYPLGECFEDRIISVTPEEWTMLEGATGNKSVARRVQRP
jgi:hypothetical protein